MFPSWNGQGATPPGLASETGVAVRDLFMGRLVLGLGG